MLGAHREGPTSGVGVGEAASEQKGPAASPEPKPPLEERLGGKGKVQPLARSPSLPSKEGLAGRAAVRGWGKSERGAGRPRGAKCHCVRFVGQPSLPTRAQRLSALPGQGATPPFPGAGWGPDKPPYCESSPQKKVHSLSPAEEAPPGRTIQKGRGGWKGWGELGPLPLAPQRSAGSRGPRDLPARPKLRP